MDAPLRQTQHYSPQIIEVAGQPVHRVTIHSIAFVDEVLHGLQLGPLRTLAGGSVSKGSVQGQPFELANLVLIQGADAVLLQKFGCVVANAKMESASRSIPGEA